MWKQIEGYEGYYEASDDGRIRSVDRYVTDTKGAHKGKKRLLRGAEMVQSEASSRNGNVGYLVVNLHKNGKSNIILVHLLIAKTFIDNPLCLPTVNHIDGNKQNNKIENLEWASYSDNNAHALYTGLRSPRGVAVAQYDYNGNLIKCYKSVTDASRESGISRGMISHCINGRLKQASGYIWKKLSESQTTIPIGSTQEDELPAEAQRPR